MHSLDWGEQRRQCPPTRALSLSKRLRGSAATSSQRRTRPADEWALFSQHALLAKMKAPRAGCGDTSTGLFQHPLHWEQWTQRAEKKSDIYCHRLPHKELKRDTGRRGRGGGGEGGGWETRGPSLLTVMNEWITTHLGRRPSHPRRELLQWHEWQLRSALHLHPPPPTAARFTQPPCCNRSTPLTRK